MTLVISIIILCAVATALYISHQRSLHRRAHLMREAIWNHDWSFGLSTKGLTSGERAMQEALNELGEVIHQQMSMHEVEAWERLTRILTHEIMNSTAPIASISQSLLKRQDVVGTPLEAGIRSINTTASRLTTFVESYRKLAQLQQPQPEDVHLYTFFAEVQRLYPLLTWDSVGMQEMAVHTDPVLLQQVVVNLVKNALEAGATKIKISSLPTREGGGWVLISNNGSPIPAADRDSIFIPFFTTKRQGTGIGLALARQIMVRQGGSLDLMERPETGYTTTFKLSL